MMKFEDFAEELRSRVEAGLGKDSRVLISHTLKNNAVVQPQLMLQKPGCPVCPAAYLQEQYELYMEQPDHNRLNWVAENVIRLCEGWETEMDEATKLAMGLGDYGYVKDRILYKLVNTKDNQDLLTQIPHIPYLDLSIVFYIVASETEEGRMTALINNQHMEFWNVTADELYQAAAKNTPEKMPAMFCSMKELIFGSDEELEENPTDEWGDGLFSTGPCNGVPPLYVLTNMARIQGASVILYPEMMKKCAEAFKKDVIILPSSIHEVLLFPYEKEMDAKELSFMIQSINTTDVPREEWLSDHAYLYRREDDKVTAA